MGKMRTPFFGVLEKFQKSTLFYKEGEEVYTHIYVIMKTMYPPGYHHNGFVATHALGHMMYGYTLLAPMNQTITLLALLVEHSLVHWYQQCVTVHHVPKCMSCHKAIVVITGRAHCFHGYIYITPILLL